MVKSSVIGGSGVCSSPPRPRHLRHARRPPPPHPPTRYPSFHPLHTVLNLSFPDTFSSTVLSSSSLPLCSPVLSFQFSLFSCFPPRLSQPPPSPSLSSSQCHHFLSSSSPGVLMSFAFPPPLPPSAWAARDAVMEVRVMLVLQCQIYVKKSGYELYLRLISTPSKTRDPSGV